MDVTVATVCFGHRRRGQFTAGGLPALGQYLPGRAWKERRVAIGAFFGAALYVLERGNIKSRSHTLGIKPPSGANRNYSEYLGRYGIAR